jgi:hypothetical protein
MRRSLAALSVALLLAGCTTAPATPTTPATPTMPASSPATPPTSPPPSPSDTPVPMPSTNLQVVEISLKDGKVTPNGDRLSLKKDTILRLEITSDHDDEVHVHGYDVEIPVKAGATATKTITLDQVGRFEVESHEPALTILQLVVS